MPKKKNLATKLIKAAIDTKKQIERQIARTSRQPKTLRQPEEVKRLKRKIRSLKMKEPQERVQQIKERISVLRQKQLFIKR